jgi:hypothetical protein
MPPSRISGEAMTAEPKPLPEVERFTIQWYGDLSCYKVSIPGFDGGEVILASTFDAHVAALKEAVRVLRGQVRHGSDCDVVKPLAWTNECTCGASKALADTAGWEK